MASASSARVLQSASPLAYPFPPLSSAALILFSNTTHVPAYTPCHMWLLLNSRNPRKQRCPYKCSPLATIARCRTLKCTSKTLATSGTHSSVEFATLPEHCKRISFSLSFPSFSQASHDRHRPQSLPTQLGARRLAKRVHVAAPSLALPSQLTQGTSRSDRTGTTPTTAVCSHSPVSGASGAPPSPRATSLVYPLALLRSGYSGMSCKPFSS